MMLLSNLRNRISMLVGITTKRKLHPSYPKLSTTVGIVDDFDDLSKFIKKQNLPVRILIKNLQDRISDKDKQLLDKNEQILDKNEQILDKNEQILDKEKVFKSSEKLFKLEHEHANIRILQLIGDVSLRRVVEELEKKTFFRNARGFLLEQKEDGKARKPSRKELWNAVLANQLSSTEFPELYALYVQGVPVAGVLAELITLGNKNIHTGKITKVLIDTERVTDLQVQLN